MSKKNRLRVRWGLAIFSFGLALLIAIYDGYFYLYPSLFPPATEVVGSRSYNELTKAAMDLRTSQSTSLFQFGLLLTGTLWALLIAKRDEVRLVFSDRPEICMFICASALLVASTISYACYLNEITYVYADSGNAAEEVAKLAQVSPELTSTGAVPDTNVKPIPAPSPVERSPNGKPAPQVQDIFDSSIDYLFVSQFVCLAFGVLIALLTLVSTHTIRSAEQCDTSLPL